MADLADISESTLRFITMGCGEQCPYVAGIQRTDWPLPDPIVGRKAERSKGTWRIVEGWCSTPEE